MNVKRILRAEPTSPHSDNRVSAKARHLLRIALVATLLPSCESTNPDVTRGADGQYQPRVGYIWAHPNNSWDLSTVPDPNYVADTSSYSPTTYTPTTQASDRNSSGSSTPGPVETAGIKGANDLHHEQQEMYSPDVVNWVEIEPGSVARGDNSHLQLRVNLVGSPARKGLVHIEQTFGHDVGTVFGPGWVEYEPGQNMVDSYISIVSFKRGTIGIKAWVTNYGTPDSVALTTVEVY